MKFGSLVLRLILSTTSTFDPELMLPCRGFRPACLVQASEPPFVSRLTTGRDYIDLTNTIQAKNGKFLKIFLPYGRISISQQICDQIVVMLPAQPWSSSAWPCHPPVAPLGLGRKRNLLPEAYATGYETYSPYRGLAKTRILKIRHRQQIHLALAPSFWKVLYCKTSAVS